MHPPHSRKQKKRLVRWMLSKICSVTLMQGSTCMQLDLVPHLAEEDQGFFSVHTTDGGSCSRTLGTTLRSAPPSWPGWCSWNLNSPREM